MKNFSHQAFREIEKDLSSFLFQGIPLGATFNDILAIKFLGGTESWGWKTRILNRALMLRHWLCPRRSKASPPPLPAGCILVAWVDAGPRFSGLMQPVLNELKGESCAVVCGMPKVASLVPPDVPSIVWDQVWPFVVKDWRVEYCRCRSDWAASLKSMRRRFDLPAGAFEQLAFLLMIASQNVTGCLSFLKAARPAAIVTDFDRHSKWSCLVLAARLLGIPTVTLVHGVMYDDGLIFTPVLADRIVCWGEFDRKKLLAAGEPPEKVVIGGCPRLSRDLSADVKLSRMKLSLDPQKPVIMFATNHMRHRLELAEMFCIAVEKLDFLSGMVRLHPVEKLSDYEAISRRYPSVRFFENTAATLDESLAAADVIAVSGSGVGSDALVKRRLVVVLDREARPTGPGGNLVEYAGCPHARTSDELIGILQHVLSDETYRRDLALAAEQYVESFCSAYSEDSARRIAAVVRDAARSPKEKLSNRI